MDREQRLRQEHAFFFDHASDLFCVLDTAGRFVDVNPAWERLFGYSAAELRGQRIGAYLHPDDPAPELGERELAPDPATLHRFDVRCRTRAGTYRWLRWKSVVDREHGLRYTVARDITSPIGAAEPGAHDTATKQASMERIDSIAVLAGGISHHFNNLLCVTLGYIHMMLDEMTTTDPLRGHALEIQSATERAVDMIQKLRMFSQRQDAETSLLDLNQVLLGIETLVRHLVTEQIDVQLELAPQVARVRGSRGLIEQAIVNLVMNARDFMPAGGTLTIRTALVQGAERGPGGLRGAPQVALSVIDTGTGIPAAAADHLFEPFFTTKDVGDGPGLGLATVYGIARQCGGHVSVHSTPGRGSTFTLYLPAVSEAPAQPVAAAHASVPVTGAPGGETIVVVEDDEKVRGLVYQSLKRQGYQVLMAASGDRALPLIERHPGPVHLLLTDVLLPGLSGPAIASQLRAQRPDVRVLYMTGYPGDQLPHIGDVASLGPVLAKPFTPAQLTQLVREVLDQPAPAVRLGEGALEASRPNTHD